MKFVVSQAQQVRNCIHGGLNLFLMHNVVNAVKSSVQILHGNKNEIINEK